MTALARSIGQRLDFLYPIALQESKHLFWFHIKLVIKAPVPRQIP